MVRIVFSSILLVVLIQVAFAALNKKQKQELLDAHNFLRVNIVNGGDGQPPAANMLSMEWDDEAAAKAQYWAEQCVIGHDQPAARTFGPFTSVGQNWAGSHSSVSEMVKMWYDEFKFYDFNSNGCSDACGHYTQVIWATSNKVGCGLADCTGANGYPSTLVCNYAPGGNFRGAKPYTAGSACSKCPASHPFCKDGLCSATCQGSGCQCLISSCENGNLNSKTCSCQCKTDYFGYRCEKLCKDDPGSYCNKLASEYNCKTYSNVPVECPKSCGVCNKGEAEYSSKNAQNIKTRIVDSYPQ